MNGSYNRRPNAKHQPDAGGNREQRTCYVDGRQAVTAHTVTNEDAFRNNKCGGGKHAKEGRDEEFAEHFWNAHGGKIDGVALHLFGWNLILVAKVGY